MITRFDRCAVAIAIAAITFAPSARAQDRAPPAADEPLDALRERFREGMEKYRAGQFADAILVWEQIYRELGTEQGYRLAFNLGRAYDAYGDSTRAAESYETFLRNVQTRRDRGETLEANVEKQEAETHERLDELTKTKGRIRVNAGDRPTAVRIDKKGEPRLAGFVAYVGPGKHVVTFGSGKDEKDIEVSVAASEIVEVTPPPETPEPPPPQPPTRFEMRTERPFSPTLLWIAGGITVASIVVPILTYSHVLSLKSQYDAANDGTQNENEAALGSRYDSAKSTAYTTVLVPVGLAAGTAALAAWYFLGAKETRVPVATISAKGASIGVAGHF